MTHIADLRDVIRRLHGAEATHIESVPVKDVFQGQTVWDGVVEVFSLEGHPKANTAYAWVHDTGDASKPTKSVAVLKVPPVVSPLTAVRAFIVKEFRTDAQA
jgi:hypothetical protein